jgi:hypothetical protein
MRSAALLGSLGVAASAAAPAGAEAASTPSAWRVTSVEVDGTTTIHRTDGERTLDLTGRTGYHGTPRQGRLRIGASVPVASRLTGLDISMSSTATLDEGGEAVDCSWTATGPALPPALALTAVRRARGGITVQWSFAPAGARCPDGHEPPDGDPIAALPTTDHPARALRGRTAKLSIDVTQKSPDGAVTVRWKGTVGLRR